MRQVGRAMYSNDGPMAQEYGREFDAILSGGPKIPKYSKDRKSPQPIPMIEIILENTIKSSMEKQEDVLA